MNVDAEGVGQIGEALGGGLLADVDIGPIDPDEPGDAVARELAKLVVADHPQKDDIKSGVVAKVFAAVQKLDHPRANADELNLVGCGWALLAYKEARLDYWPRATASLVASRDYPKATPEQTGRATENIEHVKNARAALGSA
jgi:hypothetical protein